MYLNKKRLMADVWSIETLIYKWLYLPNLSIPIKYYANI